MLRTKNDKAASPREATGCGVEVGLSFPFLAAPPLAVLRREVPLAELLPSGLADALARPLNGGAPLRLHVGSDTCERLLPSPRSLAAWIDAARGTGWAATLVLPPLSRDGQGRAQECVHAMEKAPGAEVVANDWGTVHLLRARHPDLPIVLGRLTHKVLRDPRLADLFDSPQAPMAARSALCRSGELAPGFRALMARYGIARREIDPFLQPLEESEWEGRGDQTRGIPACPGTRPSMAVGLVERLSVHLPYQFVTMGRGCLPAAMHAEGKGKFVAGGPCRTECAKYAVEFRVPVPGGNGPGRHLLSLGNALYHAVPPHVTERVLARLPSGGRVDRVVVTIPSLDGTPSAGATKSGASLPAPALGHPWPS